MATCTALPLSLNLGIRRVSKLTRGLRTCHTPKPTAVTIARANVIATGKYFSFRGARMLAGVGAWTTAVEETATLVSVEGSQIRPAETGARIGEGLEVTGCGGR